MNMNLKYTRECSRKMKLT